MKRYIKDNPEITIEDESLFYVIIHWGSSHILKVYTNKSGERFVRLHKQRYYL